MVIVLALKLLVWKKSTAVLVPQIEYLEGQQVRMQAGRERLIDKVLDLAPRRALAGKDPSNGRHSRDGFQDELVIGYA